MEPFSTNIVCYEPIGLIHTPFKHLDKMPIQAFGGQNVFGYIDLDEQLMPALKDLDGFSHITLIYSFHKVSGFALEVTPFMDNTPHGLFATRVPRRPNAIGMSTVKLERVEDNRIYISDVDMLDETPLLDIKPYFRQFDVRADAKCGWLDKQDQEKIRCVQSDDRFINK